MGPQRASPPRAGAHARAQGKAWRIGRAHRRAATRRAARRAARGPGQLFKGEGKIAKPAPVNYAYVAATLSRILIEKHDITPDKSAHLAALEAVNKLHGTTLSLDAVKRTYSKLRDDGSLPYEAGGGLARANLEDRHLT